jgi:hypothetical protein
MTKRPKRPKARLSDYTQLAAERSRERRAQRELGIKIANTGFRELAKKLHPDVGGSHEAMARLTRARDHLKTMA